MTTQNQQTMPQTQKGCWIIPKNLPISHSAQDMGALIGLRRIFKGLRTIAYCERDAFACANLVSKIEKGYMDAAPIWSNLEDFPYEDFLGIVDIMSGGIPCQPFSIAGKKEAERSEKFLYPSFSRGIGICRPKIVIIENVEGLRSVRFDHTLSKQYIDQYRTDSILLHILRDLENLGYACHFRFETASRVGFPHSRRRIFIGAIRNDISPEQIQEFFVGTEQLTIEKSPNYKTTTQHAWENPRLVDILPTKKPRPIP